ncbi:MAG: AAA family ATPase [Bacteroidetes bacterium]|nr:AAA family ATPase [Bacteroidota bacterium]
MFGVPKTLRWAFPNLLSGLEKGPTPITVLRGPRQIGKTTLLNQVIDQLLDEGVPPDCIFRVQFDELPEMMKLTQPILDLTQWYSDTILKTSLNNAALTGKKVYVFLDEVQNLPDWAPQLKHLVDLQPVRVVVTGSSALRIEAGRDSLAGRITTLEMGPLLLREVATLREIGEIPPYLPANGIGPLKEKSFWIGLREHGEKNKVLRDQAFAAFSERGAYPIAHAKKDLP